jgi:hypothetical protein
MNKPAAAQLKDPQWWGVWASEDATHYSDYYGAFVKPFDLDQWVVLRQGPKPVVTFMDTGMLFDRPKSHSTDTQPAESGAQISAEWDGEGLPPVGAMCERQYGSKVYRVEVVGYHEGTVVVFQLDASPDYTDFHPNCLKPLRTQAERERDDLAEALGNCVKMRTTFGEMVDVIIAAGWRKAGEQ